jgi:hypothetical protein
VPAHPIELVYLIAFFTPEKLGDVPVLLFDNVHCEEGRLAASARVWFFFEMQARKRGG